MNLDKKQYKRYAAARAPKSPLVSNSLKAFLVGGLICTAAQGMSDLYSRIPGVEKETAGTFTAVTLIFIAVFLTAVGLFDKIAKFAGAGTLVPITGFANAVASPAIDSHAEGLILGIGAKIFTVAGPVLLYGTLSGTLYGILYYIWAILF